MKLLISTYNYIGVYDLNNTQLTKIHQKAGKYFGLTWNNEHLFATVGVRLNLGEKYGEKTEYILMFNKQLEYIGNLFNQDVGFKNIHQLLYNNEQLLMANSGKNRIDKYSFKTREIKPWYPLKLFRNRDFHHFNSLLVCNNRLYLLAHNNKKKSKIFVYQYPELKRIKKYTLGRQSHNLYVENDEIFTCDSYESGNVISTKGTELKINDGYVRGLAVSDEQIFVGSSNKAERKERQNGDCRIYVFDRNTKNFNKKLTLPDAGNIYDIRILDEFDHAHGVKPFIS